MTLRNNILSVSFISLILLLIPVFQDWRSLMKCSCVDGQMIMDDLCIVDRQTIMDDLWIMDGQKIMNDLCSTLPSCYLSALIKLADFIHFITELVEHFREILFNILSCLRILVFSCMKRACLTEITISLILLICGPTIHYNLSIIRRRNLLLLVHLKNYHWI